MRHPEATSALPQSQPSRASDDDGRLRKGLSRLPSRQPIRPAPTAVIAIDPIAIDPLTETSMASTRLPVADLDASASTIGTTAPPGALLAFSPHFPAAPTRRKTVPLPRKPRA